MRDDAAALVAEHYNQRPQFAPEERQLSQVFHLKALHNWIKAVLISKFTSRGDVVLDLCCGKGGDLGKWSRLRVDCVVGVDIASVSVDQALERYKDMRADMRASFKAYFYPGDVFAVCSVLSH